MKLKKQEGGFLGSVAASLIEPMTSSLIQPVASSLINAISGKRVMRAGKGEEGAFLSLLALPLMIKAMSRKKESQEQEKDIIIWIIWIKTCSSSPSLN